ncbi:MAG: LptF/LptG family permease [Campylobacterota bacterium]|nr:LptF/LptG family permease [Campylobacterota bacterium]
MVNVRGYISSNFTKAFLTIFLPFFLIISLVFLVKISSLTSKIQISFGELFELFAYSIPEIIFYTLPLSFVAALANVLMKLSQDNELIALYALGLKAKKVLKSLLLLATLFSVLLLSISFLAMPLSKQFYKAFKASKKSEAKLNIVAGKLGQKFGNYYIYLEENRDDIFHNIVIYNRTKKDEEQFFSAQEGKINKNSETTSLLLNNGYGYTYTKDKLQQAEYKTLEVYDTTKKKFFKFEDISIYWSKLKKSERLMKKALFYLFVSLIPLLSVYLIAAFTMINPRYQSNHSFIVIFSITFIFYMLASILQKWGNYYLLILFIIFMTFMGKWFFKQRVERYF